MPTRDAHPSIGIQSFYWGLNKDPNLCEMSDRGIEAVELSLQPLSSQRVRVMSQGSKAQPSNYMTCHSYLVRELRPSGLSVAVPPWVISFKINCQVLRYPPGVSSLAHSGVVQGAHSEWRYSCSNGLEDTFQERPDHSLHSGSILYCIPMCLKDTTWKQWWHCKVIFITLWWIVRLL